MQFIKNIWQSTKAVCKKVSDKAQALAVTAATGVATLLGFQTEAQAAGPDLSSLTGAIDFATVVTAVLAVAAAIVVVYLAMKGAKIVLAMLRGA